MTRFTKSFIAHITFVRSLVRVNTHVVLQIASLSKTLLAHITFIRFLVRVNTHVGVQTIRLSKTLLAHITFLRFLLRVNTHVADQEGWISKHLLAHPALVPSLSLHSFSNKSSFLFSHLILFRDTRHAQNPSQSLYVFVFVFFFFFFFLYLMISLEIILLVRNLRTQHLWFFSRHLQNRPRVHRSFRMWIFPSAHSYTILAARLKLRE